MKSKEYKYNRYIKIRILSNLNILYNKRKLLKQNRNRSYYNKYISIFIISNTIFIKQDFS